MRNSWNSSESVSTRLKPQHRFKRTIATLMVAALSLGTLSACVTDQGTKQFAGTILGAGAGGLAGSKIGKGDGRLVAVAAGTMLGGLLGNSVGQSLDRADQLYAQRAQQTAVQAPVGQTIAWSNPNTGNHGTVTPTREGTQTSTGAYCREYHTEVIVGGNPQVGYGTACRMPDGDWQIKS